MKDNSHRRNEHTAKKTTNTDTERNSGDNKSRSAMPSTTRRSVLATLGAAVGAGLSLGTGDVQAQSNYDSGRQARMYEYGKPQSTDFIETTYDNPNLSRLPPLSDSHAHDGQIVTKGLYRAGRNLVSRNTARGRSEIRGSVGIDPRTETTEKVHIHVHGHFNTYTDARDAISTIASFDQKPNGEKITDYKHLGFVWNAMYSFYAAYWESSRTSARENGRRLGEYIAQIKDNGTEKVVITAHSLGSEVTCEAIRYLYHAGVTINGVFFMGAAVPVNYIKTSAIDLNYTNAENHLWSRETGPDYNRVTEHWVENVRPYGQDLDAVTPDVTGEDGLKEKRIYSYRSEIDEALPAFEAINNKIALGLEGVAGDDGIIQGVPQKFEQIRKDGFMHSSYLTNEDHWDEVYGIMSQW